MGFHSGLLAWVALAVASSVLLALILLKLIVGEHTDLLQPQWIMSRDDRHNSGLMCAVGAACQAWSLFYAAGYSSKEKRPAGILATAYCALVAVSFVLDAYGFFYRAGYIELYLWALLVTGGVVTWSSVWYILDLQQGRSVAEKVTRSTTVWASIPWTLVLYPLPRAIVQNWDHPAAVPLASVVTLLEVGGFLLITGRATAKISAYIPLHWTVAISGLQVILAWLAGDFIFIHLATLGPGGSPRLPVRYAYAAGQAQLLLQCIALNVSISESIFTFEESARLKAERDAAKAELAVRTQQQQQAVEATEARQRFLRYVFHELRVPFNSLDMGLGMIMEDISSGPMKEEVRLGASAISTLGMMAKAAASMKVIINDTLDWTKLQSGAFKVVLGPTCLQDVISTTILGLRPFFEHGDNNVTVSLDFDPALPTCLLADKVRMQQVIANFVSNAVKFAPHDGTGVVRLSARVLSEGEEAWAGYEDVWWKPTQVGGTQTGTFASTTAANSGSFIDRLSTSLSPSGSSFVVVQQGKRVVTGSFTRFDSQGGDELAQPVIARHAAEPLLALPALPEFAAEKLAVEGYTMLPANNSCTVLISVRDNGDGIQVSEMPGLFRAFRQLDAGMQYKGKGTGLGLAICHEIVSLHGGRVGVRSAGKKGAGAEFLIALRLPVLQQALGQPGRSVPGASSWVAGAPRAGDPTATTQGPMSLAETPLSLSPRPPDSLLMNVSPVVTSMTPPRQGQRKAPQNYLNGEESAGTCVTSADVPGAVQSSASSERDPCEALSCATRESSLFVTTPPAAVPLDRSQRITSHGDTVKTTESGSNSAGVQDSELHAFDVHVSKVAAPVRDSKKQLRSFNSDSAGHGHAPVPMPLANASRRASALLPPVSALHEHTAGTGPTIRILCVDDVADSRKLLVKALQRRLPKLFLQDPMGSGVGLPHFEFEEAEDGHIAVQMVTGRQVDVMATPPRLLPAPPQGQNNAVHSVRTYDVITMDAEMPTLSGFEAARILRAAGYTGPLFGCTGNALEADQMLFRKNGASDVFIKPLDLQSLGQAIHAVLAKAARAPVGIN